MDKFLQSWEGKTVAIFGAVVSFFTGLILTKSPEFLLALLGWALIVVPAYLLVRWFFFTPKDEPAPADLVEEE